MNSADWIEVERRYYMQTVRRQPVVIARGQGTRAWDVDGKEYLDFTAGWAVDNLGHCHPAVTQAIVEQANTLLQTSNQFYTVPQLKLVEMLVKNSCMDRVFLCNSGAEANEGAVKTARKYGRLHRNGAYEIITALNSFHGRTMMMVAATGNPHYQEPWAPLPPGFKNVEYDNIEAIMAATDEKTCAVMIEPVQGEGGVIVPSPSYLRQVRDWCTTKDLVLIFDEVQTGMGRLGTLWGYQAFGVEPDVMSTAKGLGNGVPIGAFMAKQKYTTLEPGDHGSTFGGNALTTAAAYATLKYMIEHDVPRNTRVMGQYLRQSLEELRQRRPGIKEVRGMGLLVALEFEQPVAAKLVGIANEEGLLLNSPRPATIRFMPPLTISQGEIDEGIARLEKAIARLS